MFLSAIGKPGNPCPTLLTGDYQVIAVHFPDAPEQDYIRKLTVTEFEMLMGVPIGWTKFGHEGQRISDSARFKALGNSIVLGCAEYIMAGAAAILQQKEVFNEQAEHDIFRSVIESGRHCESMKDIINIAENMDCFDLQPAFSAEMYGDFLAQMNRDHFAEAIEALEKSDDPVMRELAAHIDMLDNHLNAESYGRAIAEQENGVFTEQGLLTENSAFREVYRGPEDIPHEYRVFAYPEPLAQERPSVMDKLAAAKESVKARGDGEQQPNKPGKSHDAEL